MKKSKEEYVKEWFVKAKSDLKIARREMTALDPAVDAVDSRYPESMFVPDIDDMQTAAELAATVETFVTGKLQNRGFSPT